MENNHDQPQKQEDSNMNNLVTSVLFICTGLFQWLSQNMTAESAFNWFFKILSLISLTMIIIINWPKAKKVIFKNKRKL